MESIEKATYLIFGRGHNPQQLRLGNLVTSPSNPAESDPFVCPYDIDTLKAWTGEGTEEPTLKIHRVDSTEKGALVKLTGLIGGDINQSQGSVMTVEGKNSRRFEIQQATNFLNMVILPLPDAKQWLESRIRISKTMLRLNKLKPRRDSRHPQIWMVTGIQMLSDATVCSERSGSAKKGANLQVPMPEAATTVLAAIGTETKIADAEVTSSKAGESSVEYSHEDERIWAAQFRRLKLDFIDIDEPQSEDRSPVSLDDLLHLGLKGMKGINPPTLDQTDHIRMSDEVAGINDICPITDDELKLSEHIRNTPGKHALLIGGSEHELEGVQTDLQAMKDILLDRGFSISLCFGRDATRDGILRSWAEFLSEIPEQSQDAVVVYYSGHGGGIGLDETAVAGGGKKEINIQYLVPFDITETTEEQFRGILDVEFSRFVNRLTDRTHNVTVITDCCHAERMARDEEAVHGQRTWSPLKENAIRSHIERLRQKGFYSDLCIEGNRYAVRLAAAQSDKKAYEGSATRDLQGLPPGSKMGRLTKELVQELRSNSDQRISWDMLLSRLQQSLKEPEQQFQRPSIQGPRTRVLLSLDRLDSHWGRLNARFLEGSNIQLDGGELAGIKTGDKYAIMTRDAVSKGLMQKIATAEVETIWIDHAIASFIPEGQGPGSTAWAVALPVKRERATYQVAIRSNDESLRNELQTKVEQNVFFGVQTDSHNPFATIEQDQRNLTLRYRENKLSLDFPMLTDSSGDAIKDLLSQLEKLVLADQLRKLAPADKADMLDVSSVHIEFGRILYGAATPFNDGLCQIYDGDASYVIIGNRGTSSIFASVFLVTSLGNIHCLTHAYPLGVEIKEKAEYFPGQPSHGWTTVQRKHVIGQTQTRPKTVLQDTDDLEETYVVVLTKKPADLGFWQNVQRQELDGKREYDPESSTKSYGPEDFSFAVECKSLKLLKRP